MTTVLGASVTPLTALDTFFLEVLCHCRLGATRVVFNGGGAVTAVSFAALQSICVGGGRCHPFCARQLRMGFTIYFDLVRQRGYAPEYAPSGKWYTQLRGRRPPRSPADCFPNGLVLPPEDADAAGYSESKGPEDSVDNHVPLGTPVRPPTTPRRRAAAGTSSDAPPRSYKEALLPGKPSTPSTPRRAAGVHGTVAGLSNLSLPMEIKVRQWGGGFGVWCGVCAPVVPVAVWVRIARCIVTSCPLGLFLCSVRF